MTPVALSRTSMMLPVLRAAAKGSRGDWIIKEPVTAMDRLTAVCTRCGAILGVRADTLDIPPLECSCDRASEIAEWNT